MTHASETGHGAAFLMVCSDSERNRGLHMCPHAIHRVSDGRVSWSLGKLHECTSKHSMIGEGLWRGLLGKTDR